MLRDKSLAALDDIIRECREAADLYWEAAGLAAEEMDLANLFISLAGRRHRVAAELEEHLRRLGDLPGAPDRDRETIDELLARLKAAWAEDKRLALIEERRQAEAALAGKAEAALALEYPEETCAALAAVREEAAAAEQKLKAAAEAIAAGSRPA